MQLSSVQKIKIILFLNFFALFVLIIFTPYFIEEGISIFKEPFVEGAFLTIELLALYFMFNYYDAIMEKKERENFLLNLKLRKKERELLSAFQYMGKVNVQVSMIKSVFENIKTPSSKQELKSTYRELLRLVCSTSGEECAGLRILDLKTKRTLGDFIENFSSGEDLCSKVSFGNRDLIESFEKKSGQINDFEVFYSEADNFSVKAFVFVPISGGRKATEDEKEFIEMLANQCEIFYLLYSLQSGKK